MNNDTLIRNLRMAMINNNLNARQLGIKANVGASFIYDILSGKSKNPTIEKLSKIAESLNINIYDLIGHDIKIPSLPPMVSVLLHNTRALAMKIRADLFSKLINSPVDLEHKYELHKIYTFDGTESYDIVNATTQKLVAKDIKF